jgi:hypothetical protein
MQKSVLLRALRQEIRRHDFSCFGDQPPSVARGGKGVVVPGCPTCKKRINTVSRGVAPRPRFLVAPLAALHLPVL